MEEKRNQRRTLIGVVVSDKAQKTITVESERLSMHPKFKKYIKRRSRFYAHDEANEAKPGDVVEIMETRPLSSMKRFRLIRIIRRGKGKSSRAAAVTEAKS